MKALLIVYFLLLLPILPQQDMASNFYKALSSKEISIIDKQIKELQNLETNSQIRAYQGAIIMKRSSFEEAVKDKIAMFRKGHTALEEEIVKFPDNIEYRFLRLAIQENAPSILGYNSNIKTDKLIIIEQYNNLPQTLKTHILNYSKDSKILSSEKLL
ncbi:MAG: hypothetical protein OEW67_01590 [Cyclobacteriaceae bacterium]|nr:hypothetical protein [Cyclobacteriaceae bacterium]